MLLFCLQALRFVKVKALESMSRLSSWHMRVALASQRETSSKSAFSTALSLSLLSLGPVIEVIYFPCDSSCFCVFSRYHFTFTLILHSFCQMFFFYPSQSSPSPQDLQEIVVDSSDKVLKLIDQGSCRDRTVVSIWYRKYVLLVSVVKHRAFINTVQIVSLDLPLAVVFLTGFEHRATAATQMKATSSRSHCLFIIKMHQKDGTHTVLPC